MQLVAPNDPILRRVCRPDFTVTLDQINQMFFLMREKNALALAAPQVGIDARLFVTHWGEVFVNPFLITYGGRTVFNEGCLSLPGVTIKKMRWETIVLGDGRAFGNDRARVIQHEINHLNGILLTDKEW